MILNDSLISIIMFVLNLSISPEFVFESHCHSALFTHSSLSSPAFLSCTLLSKIFYGIHLLP